jgi:diketogulonate reductase-like aldo/keto reductase
VEAFERLIEQGKIRRWGVSNFDLDDMHELGNAACATNQVLYNPAERGIEFDLLPWSRAQQLPIMAYCPLAQAGRLLHHPVMAQVGARHGATPAQVSQAWVTRGEGVIAIPKAVNPEHVRLNAHAAELVLSEEDLRAIDQAFAPPTRKQRLAMV